VPACKGGKGVAPIGQGPLERPAAGVKDCDTSREKTFRPALNLPECRRDQSAVAVSAAIGAPPDTPPQAPIETTRPDMSPPGGSLLFFVFLARLDARPWRRVPDWI